MSVMEIMVQSMIPWLSGRMTSKMLAPRHQLAAHVVKRASFFLLVLILTVLFLNHDMCVCVGHISYQELRLDSFFSGGLEVRTQPPSLLCPAHAQVA